MLDRRDGSRTNIASIRTAASQRSSTFGDGPTDAILVDNDDWLDQLGYIELLRDVGPHFTINRMLTFDSVKLRLDREQPLTFLEFNYMILQAYDFLKLRRDHGCRLQMGGSDQWGNIVNGIELGRRMDGAELFGVTAPLITTADGSEDGQDRSTARCGSTRTSSRPRISGSTGATPTTATWAASCACSPTCRWTRSRASKARGQRDQRGQGGARQRSHRRWCGATRRPGRPKRPPPRPFGAGGLGEDLPVLDVPAEGISPRLPPSPQLGFTASNGEAKRKIAEGAVRHRRRGGEGSGAADRACRGRGTQS